MYEAGSASVASLLSNLGGGSGKYRSSSASTAAANGATNVTPAESHHPDTLYKIERAKNSMRLDLAAAGLSSMPALDLLDAQGPSYHQSVQSPRISPYLPMDLPSLA
mgnify:CR=1 FL=1